MPSDQFPPPTNPEPQEPLSEADAAIDPPEAALSELPALPETEATEPVEATEPIAPPGRPPLPPGFVDETLPETAVRLLKQAVRDAQPIAKDLTIKTLKSTIALLEGAVDRLEAGPRQPVAPIETSAAATTIASESSAGAAAPTIVPEVPLPVPDAPSDRPILATESPWQKLQGWWGDLLGWVRSRLPASLKQLDDRVLSGAIVSVLVGLLWIVPGLFAGKPAEVAIVPPAPEASPTPQPVPPQVKAPEPPKPVPIKPEPAPPAPQPKPSPALQLSPEQKLIASIQDQVAEVSDRYSSSLIESVQANFRSSRLVVKLGDSWYGLSEAQQNKLSNELLQRAQKLDFVKLELSDPQGVLLARSPVVGSEMIILKRSNGAELSPEQAA